MALINLRPDRDGSIAEDGAVNWAGAASFLGSLWAGAVTPAARAAIVFAGDLLPLERDFYHVLGASRTPDGRYVVDADRAEEGLWWLLLVILVAIQSRSTFHGIMASSDILPFPGDFERAVHPATAPPAGDRSPFWLMEQDAGS